MGSIGTEERGKMLKIDVAANVAQSPVGGGVLLRGRVVALVAKAAFHVFALLYVTGYIVKNLRQIVVEGFRVSRGLVLARELFLHRWQPYSLAVDT
jgi:hypothetical protein